MTEHQKRQPTEKGNSKDNGTAVPDSAVDGNIQGGQAPHEDLTVTVPVQEYEELLAQIEELKDRYLRVAADFDNYRKRAEKEKEEIVCYANEKLISDLLPVVDNLERALAADPEGLNIESILNGVRLVNQQLHSVLSGCGVEPVHAVGTAFDPRIHEAVGVLEPGEHDEGTVLAELQKGYKLKGKVLRHSVVHVAGQPGGDSEESER